MKYIHKFAFVFFLILLCFQLIGCEDDTVDTLSDLSCESSTSDDGTSVGNADSSVVEESKQPTVRNIIMTTDKTEYSFDERVVCNIRSENENEYFKFSYGPDYAFVQCWDSDTNSWANCEKDFVATDIGIEGNLNNESVSFILSERADEGKEKYRIGIEFTAGTFYSNEFTIKAETED